MGFCTLANIPSGTSEESGEPATQATNEKNLPKTGEITRAFAIYGGGVMIAANAQYVTRSK